MDIWSWVEDHLEPLRAENADLVDQIEDLSAWTCDGEHGRVDAALPALVARLRALEQPWLEVFVRHWGLQSRVLHRRDARDNVLHEATDLAERAHRDDTADCPQSICVTQDLCSAYGVLDGKGHADARIRAATEALERVTPAWPCYRCLQSELADALLDQGEFDAVLELADRAEKAMREAGNDSTLTSARTRALLELGRFEDALPHIEGYHNDGQGTTGTVANTLRHAHVLIRAGAVEEGIERLPTLEALGDEADDYVELLEIWAFLVEHHGKPLDVALATDVNRMLRVLSAHCSHRDTVDKATVWAGVGWTDGSWAYADAWCALAERHLPHLVEPLGADTPLQRLRAELNVARPEPYGSTGETADTAFQAALDSGEVSFGRMAVTSASVPTAARVVAETANHWLRLGWPERARSLVESALATASNETLLRLHMRSLLDESDYRALDQVFADHADHPSRSLQLHLRWFRSRAAEHRGRLDEALADLTFIWSNLHDLATPEVARRMAAVLQQLDRPADALAVLTDLTTQGGATRDDHWFRMELATVLEEWDVVREAAAAVELDVPGSGYIDDPSGPVRLALPEGAVWGTRLGPCHARIDSISGPNAQEIHHSVWAFDPFSGVGDDVRLYKTHRCLRDSPSTAVTVDGARLNDEDRAQLMSDIVALGGSAYLASGDGYVIHDPADGTPLEAGFLKVALPAGTTSFAALHGHLTNLAGAYSPLVWPELRDLLGDGEQANTDRQTALDWGM